MDDHEPLGSALRDRVRDEHPDLERLLAGATRAGTRIRRRRRAGAAGGTAAAVAVVAIIGVQLGGGASPTSLDDGYADRPFAAPTTAMPSDDPSATVAELQRLADLLREAERVHPADRTRLDQLRRLSDALRVADRSADGSVSRRERVAAFHDLVEALRRLETNTPRR